jgi:hypothetical protein
MWDNSSGLRGKRLKGRHLDPVQLALEYLRGTKWDNSSGFRDRGLKLSVGYGIEYMVSDPVGPIRAVRFENPTHRLAVSPTGSQSLSQ